jgi:hypothetical protein
MVMRSVLVLVLVLVSFGAAGGDAVLGGAGWCWVVAERLMGEGDGGGV